jgi:hypothetical protein
VDVKSSTLRSGRWAFSLKKQELTADFFACFAYSDDGSYTLLLVPGDVCRMYQSMSISVRTRTKWWDYQILPYELRGFFLALPSQKAA